MLPLRTKTAPFSIACAPSSMSISRADGRRSMCRCRTRERHSSSRFGLRSAESHTGGRGRISSSLSTSAMQGRREPLGWRMARIRSRSSFLVIVSSTRAASWAGTAADFGASVLCSISRKGKLSSRFDVEIEEPRSCREPSTPEQRSFSADSRTRRSHNPRSHRVVAIEMDALVPTFRSLILRVPLTRGTWGSPHRTNSCR